MKLKKVILLMTLLFLAAAAALNILFTEERGAAFTVKLAFSLVFIIISGMGSYVIYERKMRKVQKLMLLVFYPVLLLLAVGALFFMPQYLQKGLTSPFMLNALLLLAAVGIVAGIIVYVILKKPPVKSLKIIFLACIIPMGTALFTVNFPDKNILFAIRLAGSIAAAVICTVSVITFLYLKKIRRKLDRVIIVSAIILFALAQIAVLAQLGEPFFPQNTARSMLWLILIGTELLGLKVAHSYYTGRAFFPQISFFLIFTAVVTVLVFIIYYRGASGSLLFYGLYTLGIETLFIIFFSLYYDCPDLHPRYRIIFLSGIAFLLIGESLVLSILPAMAGIETMGRWHILVLSIAMGAELLAFSQLYLLATRARMFTSSGDSPKSSKGKTKKDQKPDVIKPPFPAYKGDRPYIFVSYSHRDMEEVFGIISRLDKNGYRIWYDEGIEPGNEWPEVIGKAIFKCKQQLVFLTPSAVLSRNVRNEINMAFSKNKEIVVVLLEKTGLSAGLKLQIGTIQQIKKHELSDAEFMNMMKEYLIK